MKATKRLTGGGDGNRGGAEAEGPPMHPLVAFQRSFDDAMQRAWQSFGAGLSHWRGWADWPSIDMTEDDATVTLRADLPGIDMKNLDVEVAGQALTIRGHREEERKEEKAGELVQERRVGRFSRTVQLPAYVDPDKIEARYDKGVLQITVPKIPGQGPKRVTVKAG